MTPATLSPAQLAYEQPIHPKEMPRITTCTELPVDDTNKSTSDDRYPWLDPDDIRRNMTDKEILGMKLNLKDSVLDEKGKEEFLEKVKQFTNIFSLRDEIGTCPFIEVHLKLKDKTPFFVRPYPMREEQKKVFIENRATPSILPLHTYNKFPILHTYPKTESNTPIHTGGGLIKFHFWLEIPLN